MSHSLPFQKTEIIFKTSFSPKIFIAIKLIYDYYINQLGYIFIKDPLIFIYSHKLIQ